MYRSRSFAKSVKRGCYGHCDQQHYFVQARVNLPVKFEFEDLFSSADGVGNGVMEVLTLKSVCSTKSLMEGDSLHTGQKLGD